MVTNILQPVSKNLDNLGSIFNKKDFNKLVDTRQLRLDWCGCNIKCATAEQASELLGYPAKSGGLWIEGYGGQGQFKPDEPWESTDDAGKAIKPKYRNSLGLRPPPGILTRIFWRSFIDCRS
jgi:putative DNA primase/helicase